MKSWRPPQLFFKTIQVNLSLGSQFFTWYGYRFPTLKNGDSSTNLFKLVNLETRVIETIDINVKIVRDIYMTHLKGKIVKPLNIFSSTENVTF